MPRALKVCSTKGCTNTTRAGRCDDHQAQAEERRGTAQQRGYGSRHRHRFRKGVLDKDPICVLCQREPSVVADHWPLGRDELTAQGLDPNDPKHGRGLCASCDPKQTARRQPGGWNARV